jgi:HD-GYP domain-containing protein (c-di-GMP phosphodiesterase class II)
MLDSEGANPAAARFAPTEDADAVRPLLVLAEILESRYADLRYHGQSVAAYCAMTAQELGMSKRDIARVSLGGALHDVGKVAVDERILRKTAKLDAEEWREIELHPDISANLLFSCNLFDVGRWVRAHHERLDGSGYPRGLDGERIPLEARIIAVTDAYDAMRTERVYRSALSHEQACEELVRGCGTQFDAEVVQAFMRALKRRRRRGIWQGPGRRAQDRSDGTVHQRQRAASSLTGFFLGTSP